MALTEARKIVFKFKGARDYIQGPDIYNAMIGEYDISTMTNIRFSVHDFIVVPECRLYVADSQDELSALPGICARCQFDVDTVTTWLGLTTGEGYTSTSVRVDYKEDRVISACHMGKDCITLPNLGPYTFIENIVSMSKHLHLQMFRNVSGKWLFTRLDLKTGCDTRENLSVRLRHNMNFRLTKSDVLVQEQKIGDLFFSLIKQ